MDARIGEIIRNKRKEMGITLEELSTQTGISFVTLGKYENEKVLPTVVNLYKVCTSLDLNFDQMNDLLNKTKADRKADKKKA